MIQKLFAVSIVLTSLMAFSHGFGHKKPLYLDIPGFQQCLITEPVGSAMFWCMPAQMPAGCDPHSWEKLNKLPAKERLADCKHHQ